MNKKKKNLIAIAVFMIVMLIVVGSTYAFWTTTQVQSDKNVINTTCLKVKLENQKSDGTITTGIELNEAYPVSDNVGTSYPGYTFTITNECDEKVFYDINLESLKIDNYDFTKKESNETDEQRINRENSSHYLQSEYIKAVLDPAGNVETNKLLSSYTDVKNSYLSTEDGESYERKNLLNKAELEAHGNETYTLKMWLDENAPETQMKKHYRGKVVIYSWLGESNPNPITVLEG